MPLTLLPAPLNSKSYLHLYLGYILYVSFLDPALILQDPLARDQDDDARISDAIQNDFERKQHNWRNKLMP